MPVVMEQVNQLNTMEKLRLMESLFKALSETIARYENVEQPKHRRRIGAMAGRWPDYSYERDREMDDEIAADCDAFKGRTAPPSPRSL